MEIPKDGLRLHKSNFSAIGQQLQPLLESGECYRLTIKPWRDKRGLSQNSLMWLWNSDISNQVNAISSEKLSDEEIHEFLKGMFCPEKEIEIFGESKMVRSTKLLDTEEMTFYLRRIEVWCLTKGLKIRIPPNSEYHTKRLKNE